MSKSTRKTSKRSRSGTGTIYQRGDIWWVKIHIDGRPVYESSKSTKYDDAKRLLAKLQGRKARGEITGGAPEKLLIGELLDDVLKFDIEDSTRYVWEKVVEKNLQPFFGKTRAARLTTDLMDEYRKKRTGEGRSDATVNRELSILRTAFHNARKRTPPKINNVPYFPMVKETNVRKGFVSDEQYTALRDALPKELRPLFVCDYITGIRRKELLAITWDQVDFEQGVIHLPGDITKFPATLPKTGKAGMSPSSRGTWSVSSANPSESGTSTGRSLSECSTGAANGSRTFASRGQRR
jgi:integrase